MCFTACTSGAMAVGRTRSPVFPQDVSTNTEESIKIAMISVFVMVMVCLWFQAVDVSASR